jgi:hypothetical protein
VGKGFGIVDMRRIGHQTTLFFESPKTALPRSMGLKTKWVVFLDGGMGGWNMGKGVRLLCCDGTTLLIRRVAR